jgi:hypothetical protein
MLVESVSGFTTRPLLGVVGETSAFGSLERANMGMAFSGVLGRSTGSGRLLGPGR